MLSNITIFNSLKDPFIEYGLAHFVKKYSFVLTDDVQIADIILCDTKQKINTKIQIILNSNTIEKTCYLTLNDESIPIFKTPINQVEDNTMGEIIGEIIDGNFKYGFLSISGNVIFIRINIFSEIGRILAGYYDEYFIKADDVGVRLRLIPIVDVLENILFTQINTILKDSGQKYIWPDNHKFALVLTHDVDRVYKTYQYIPSIWNSIKKANLSEFKYHLMNMIFKHRENNPYWTFEDLINLENNLDVKSTYYFLNEKGKHNPFRMESWILYKGVYDIESSPLKEIIRKLAESGFEIGVHGSYNSFNNLQLLRSEKHILELITGSEIKGVRQHYLNYDLNVTPEIHQNAGFQYDTSIGFKPINGVGFRRGTSFPFLISLPDISLSNVLEIPLIIMDGALETISTLEDCYRLINQVEKYHGVMTILWHNTRFNDRDYPTFTKIYKDIILEAKQRNAWITTAEKVYQRIMMTN